MDLEELRSVRDAERRKSGLQSLRESFYGEARDYVAALRERRDRAAERSDDPFSDPEVRRLSDEIETAEEVIEAIYERRMGKLLERAGLAAREMGADEEGLTAEEQALFSDLVDRIRANERRVLDGEDAPAEAGSGGGDPGAGASSADGDGSRVVGTADPAGGGGPGMTGTERRDQTEVSAADAMGGGSDATGTTDAGGATGAGDPTDGRSDPADRPPVETDDSTPTDGSPTDGSPVDRSVESVDPGGPGVPNPDRGDSGDAPERRPDGSGAAESTADGGPGAVAGPDAPDPSGADPGVESGPGPVSDADAGPDTDAGDDDLDRVLVRITSDVGQILGVDDREYDLTAEDVVTLPERNAAPLLKRDAAERLD